MSLAGLAKVQAIVAVFMRKCPAECETSKK
jgi:hypothetical protein